MPHDPYKALYIHIPFCVSRCGYCDFATEALPADNPFISEYVEGIVGQIRTKSREGELSELQSIYIGGGTPTHIGLKNLSSLLFGISLSVDLGRRDIEFTIEANPESLTERMVADVWALGVNRISIGVQSFDDGILTSLGRAHDAQDSRRAIQAAQSRFQNISIDLMCGIPGQTNDMLADSIEEAISFGIPHVSVYALSIEPHTPFHRALMEGRIIMPDEDSQATHLELARDMLQSAGFHRYEVSNYAKGGYESLHNSAYWTGVPYLGLGTGATTMTQNAERRMRVCNGEIVDDLDARQMAAEDLMLGMRMARGVSDETVEQAASLLPGVFATLDSLSEDGLITHAEARWRPTERGWLCGNDLYGRLLDLAP